MRFTTFVACILPLAALAAPTPRQSDSFDEYDQAYSETDSALQATINQLSNVGLTLNGHRQADLDGFKLAEAYLEIAHQAAVRIHENTSTDLSSDQVLGSLATQYAQNIITNLYAKVDDDAFADPPSDQDKSTLLPNINSALNGINEAVDAGVVLFGGA